MDCYGKLHDPNDSQCKKCALQLDCALNTLTDIQFIDTAVQLPVVYRRAFTKSTARRLAPYGTIRPILDEALMSMQGVFTRKDLQTRIIIYLAERGIPDIHSFYMSEDLMKYAYERNTIRRVSRGKYELC